MEEIIKKSVVPAMPEEVRIQYAAEVFDVCEDTRILDLSEAGVRDIVEKVRSGVYESLYLSPDEDGEPVHAYFQMESAGGDGLIFFQICDEFGQTAWSSFDPTYLDSKEDSSIECSDGQSVIPMRNTMKDRALAARCAEWFIHTLEPYPGMDWLKMTW